MANKYRGFKLNDVLQATGAAKLRYGPQYRELQGLLDQAVGNYKSDVGAAKASAASSIRAAKRAKKPTKRTFRRALNQADANRSDVQTAFTQLGGAADPFRAATEREAAAARTRIAESRADAIQGLRARKNTARLGRQFGMLKARADLSSDVAQIRGQRAGLKADEGAFVTQTLLELQAERDKARRDRRAAARGQQTQLDVANIYANANKGDGSGSDKPGGLGHPATNDQTKQLSEQISSAVINATRLKNGATKVREHGKHKGETKVLRAPMDRDTAHQTLLTNPGVKVGDTAARIALDIAYDGKLSKRNIAMLNRLGYTPARLGLKKYTPRAVRKRDRAKTRAGQKAQQNYYEGPGGTYSL